MHQRSHTQRRTQPLVRWRTLTMLGALLLTLTGLVTSPAATGASLQRKLTWQAATAQDLPVLAFAQENRPHGDNSPHEDAAEDDYQSPFPGNYGDIDEFWARTFAEHDLTYDAPDEIDDLARSQSTGCGQANADDVAAFYCPADETIYYSDEFRTIVVNQVGDYAWVTIVAHEWGHHIQAELGILAESFGAGAADDSIKRLELQADCLGGAYAADAEERGRVDRGDLNEAYVVTEGSGDAPGTTDDDPSAHGTGTERLLSFQEGMNGGVEACGIDFEDVSD